MQDFFYPPLDGEKNILLAVRLARSNILYLSDPKCPYAASIKEIFGAPKKAETDYGDDEEINVDSLQQRISRLIKELDEYGREEGRSSADKNTYFRLSVTLVKELVDLQKEVSLLAEHDAFVNEILAIMDEILDADQRASIQERLNKYIGAKNETENTEISK